MRRISLVLLAIGIAGPALGQDTIKVWRVGTTTCGLRRINGRVERFIADQTGDGLEYDFAPTASKWRLSLCDRDPSAPPPSLGDVMAQITKPTPSCGQLEATWARMTHAERLEIAQIRARQHYEDGCKLIP